MPRIIEKIVIKHGCDYDCSADCGFEQFNGGDIAEVVFQGTFEECNNNSQKLTGQAGQVGAMEHCYYSGGEASEGTYTKEQGYLVRGKINKNHYCFIAKANTDAFISYEDISPKTTEDLIEEDKKTFRSGMLSHIIKKSPCKTE